MTDKIDATRAQIYQAIFQQWPEEERHQLERLLKKFTADFTALEQNSRQ
ncbi:hypothetical protein ACFFJN_03230 [Erwinia mallotivora]